MLRGCGRRHTTGRRVSGLVTLDGRFGVGECRDQLDVLVRHADVRHVVSSVNRDPLGTLYPGRDHVHDWPKRMGRSSRTGGGFDRSRLSVLPIDQFLLERPNLGVEALWLPLASRDSRPAPPRMVLAINRLG